MCSVKSPKHNFSYGIEPTILFHPTDDFFSLRRSAFTMSSSSLPQSTTSAVPSILVIPISEKLTKNNYPLWRAQVLLAVRAAQLEGLLTGAEKSPEHFISVTNDDKTVSKVSNPAYTSWIVRDQAVLGYLLSSLTRETLMHVSRCVTAADAWGMLADLYSSQTRARAVNTRIALATTKKHHLSVSDYYAKMSSYADDLAASGSPLRDDELVAYLLAGLDEEYNPIFTAVVARVDPVTPDELYSQLLSFEQHTALQSNNSGGSSSAMAASRSGGLSGGRGFGGPSRGTSRGRGRGGRTSRGGSSNSYGRTSGVSSTGKRTRPECQICGKVGHYAKTCWYRYGEDSSPE